MLSPPVYVSARRQVLEAQAATKHGWLVALRVYAHLRCIATRKGQCIVVPHFRFTSSAAVSARGGSGWQSIGFANPAAASWREALAPITGHIHYTDSRVEQLNTKPLEAYSVALVRWA